MKLTVLDLELNQPSHKIIQLGAVALDVRSGEITSEFNSFVNPEETLDPFIIGFTRIGQSLVDQAPTLKTVLQDFYRWSPSKNLAAWGNDHLVIHQAAKDLEANPWWNTINPFNIFETANILRCAFPAGSGGLSKTLETFGLKFRGRPHNALDDARNTAFLINRMVSMIKNCKGGEELFGGADGSGV